MLNLVFLAHDVRVPAGADAVVLLGLPIAQLAVELVGCGVHGVSARFVLITVVIVEDGGFPDGHADDRVPVLVRASGAPVAVAALRPEQDGGNVVDFVGGLGAGTLLGDASALAPPVAGVQDEREEENQKQEGNEASLDGKQEKRNRECEGSTVGRQL